MESRHQLVQCPIDPEHFVKAGRLQQHIVKCKRNHLDEEFKVCPFNACHLLHPAEELSHIANCPDKVVLERQLYYACLAEGDRPLSGNLSLPDFLTESVPYEESEMWEENGDIEELITYCVESGPSETQPDDTSALPVRQPSITVMKRQLHALNRKSRSKDIVPKTHPKALAHLRQKTRIKQPNADKSTDSVARATQPTDSSGTLSGELGDDNPRSVQEILADIERAVDEVNVCLDEPVSCPLPSNTDEDGDAVTPAQVLHGVGRGILRDYQDASASVTGSTVPVSSTPKHRKVTTTKVHGQTPDAPNINRAPMPTVGRSRTLEHLMVAESTIKPTSTEITNIGSQTLQLNLVPGRGRALPLQLAKSNPLKANEIQQGQIRSTMLPARYGRGILSQRFLLNGSEPKVGWPVQS